MTDKRKSPTRPPRPPPFPIGTKLVCIGDRSNIHTAAVRSPRDITTHPEDWVRIGGKGIEVVIDEVKPGRAGTGRQCVDGDGPMFYEDTGEPIIDETKDGYSVYHVTTTDRDTGEKTRHGRIIWPDDKASWKVIK